MLPRIGRGRELLLAPGRNSTQAAGLEEASRSGNCLCEAASCLWSLWCGIDQLGDVRRSTQGRASEMSHLEGGFDMDKGVAINKQCVKGESGPPPARRACGEY
ncbi:hypothetical protein FSOLCH5_004538 [Fusarium solani]